MSLAAAIAARRAGMGGGERLASREWRGGRWTLRVHGARKRTYELQASLASLRRPFRPCGVRLAGKRVLFEWDAGQQVLRLRFTTRRGTLDVRTCG